MSAEEGPQASYNPMISMFHSRPVHVDESVSFTTNNHRQTNKKKKKKTTANTVN